MITFISARTVALLTFLATLTARSPIQQGVEVYEVPKDPVDDRHVAGKVFWIAPTQSSNGPRSITAAASPAVSRWPNGCRGRASSRSSITPHSATWANPRFGDQHLTMFYAGDPSAKQVAHALAAGLGFEPRDCGPLAIAYHLEVLASLWGTLAFGQQLGLNIGFKLLRR